MFDKLKLLAMYARLPQTEREALDETIMNEGITDLVGLLNTMEFVTTYFKEQPSHKLTFKEFQATKTAQTWGEERCKEFGIDDTEAEVLVYEDNCYIECRQNGMYYLLIGNQDWFDHRLEVLERLLYDLWYL